MLSNKNSLPGFRIPVLLKQGRRVHSDIATVIFIPNESADSHLGIVVPVKLSKRAVHRNRTKRLISEAIRTHFAKIKSGLDIIVMAKKLLREEKLTEIEEPILELLEKAGLFT
jgi:ribonuclease P protein component